MQEAYPILKKDSTQPRPAFRGSMPLTEEWQSLLTGVETAGRFVRDKTNHKQLIGEDENACI